MITEKELLKVAVIKMRKKVSQLETQIINIKESETFVTVNAIKDWDSYFSDNREHLQKELESLTLKLVN
jgi:hypothetical protein